MTSVGVSAPGIESLPRSLVLAITSRWRLGLRTNSAPASIVACAWAAVVTVPEPSSTWLPYFALRSRSRSMALGTVMVTSMTVTPPARMASTSAWASGMDRARRTGNKPTDSSCCLTCSAVISEFYPLDAGFGGRLSLLVSESGRVPTLINDEARSRLGGLFLGTAQGVKKEQDSADDD